MMTRGKILLEDTKGVDTILTAGLDKIYIGIRNSDCNTSSVALGEVAYAIAWHLPTELSERVLEEIHKMKIERIKSHKEYQRLEMEYGIKDTRNK